MFQHTFKVICRGLLLGLAGVVALHGAAVIGIYAFNWFKIAN